jgi:ABC-2 type transport system ATP-binding protein
LISLSKPPAIEVRGLSSGYGGAPVLHGITLTVQPGETLGLVGPNGAGKTTLLNSILRLVVPAAGTVSLFGEAHEAPASRAQLAYLPERFQPPGHLTGQDFVRLSLAFHRLPPDPAATAALARALDLDPLALARPIRGYAKGMAQKLGLLAALLTNRPLLLLDEPMSGLEPKARLRLKRQLAAERGHGRTILMSSPIPADHDELCDRVALLHEGVLRYLGAPADLKQRWRAATLESACLAEIEARARACERRLSAASCAQPPSPSGATKSR